MRIFLLYSTLIILIYLANATTEGDFAADDQFGYQAAIIDNNVYVCAGAIISKYFIVTAAHCFKRGRDITGITIEVGTTELTYENLKNVGHIIIHPRYYPLTKDFDIALVRLEEPLVFAGTNLKRIDFAFETYDYEGEAVTFGWNQALDANDPLKLRYTNIHVWSPKRCNSWEIWGPEAHYIFGPLVSERMICASIPDGAAGTCDLDDGGPLIDSNNELLGILSWRYDCSERNKPSVYINIPLMSTWLIKVCGNFKF